MTKKNQYYKQCLLHKIIDKKTHVRISWIPIKFCKKNKLLKLKINNNWEDGWFVHKIWSETADEDKIERLKMQCFHCREKTDI